MKTTFITALIATTALFTVSAYANTATQTTNQTITAKEVIKVNPKEPEFTLKLKSNHTTGYKWTVGTYDKKLIQLVGHQYIKPSSKLMGAPGFESWTFRVKPHAFAKSQKTNIQLIYSQAWNKNKASAKKVNFNINIQK